MENPDQKAPEAGLNEDKAGTLGKIKPSKAEASSLEMSDDKSKGRAENGT